MKFDNIEIDMLFAKLALKEIPDTMVSLFIYLIFFLFREILHLRKLVYVVSRFLNIEN